MIRRLESRNMFESLMFEAPGDEEDQPKVRRIRSNPDGRLKDMAPPVEEDDMELVDDDDTSFDMDQDSNDDTGELDTGDTADDSSESDAGAEPEVQNAPEPQAATDDGNTDAGATDNETGGELDTGDGGNTDIPSPDDGSDSGDTTDAGNDRGNDQDDGGGELQTDDPNGDDAFDVGGDTGDDSNDDSGDDSGGDSNDSQDGTVQNTEDNQLKYSLFRRMKNLMEAIDSYIEKLTEKPSPSINYNMVMRSSVDKLTEVKEALYEYMTLKFRDQEYLQSMHFYQKCLMVVRMTFELVASNKKAIDLQDETLN